MDQILQGLWVGPKGPNDKPSAGARKGPRSELLLYIYIGIFVKFWKIPLLCVWACGSTFFTIALYLIK